MVEKLKSNPAFYLALAGAAVSLLTWLIAAFDFISGSYLWIGLLGLLVCGPIALAKEPTKDRKRKNIAE